MTIKHLRIIAPEMKNTRVNPKTRVLTSQAWNIGESKVEELIGVPVSIFRNSSKESVAEGIITELQPAPPEQGENRYIITAEYTGRDSQWIGHKSNGSALVYEYMH